MFDLLERWSRVSLFAAPTMVRRMVGHPAAGTAKLEALRTIVYGGAPMYVADLKAAIGRFGFRFAQLYGQGESPMTITSMTRAMIEAAHKASRDDRLGSVRPPPSGAEVRVAHAPD